MATEVHEDIQASVAIQDTDTDDDAEEPQNALTSKFTAEEWKALKEFRVKCHSFGFTFDLTFVGPFVTENAERGVLGKLSRHAGVGVGARGGGED